MIGEIISGIITGLLGPLLAPIVTGAVAGAAIGFIGSNIFGKKQSEMLEPETLPEYRICCKIQQENLEHTHPDAKIIEQQHKKIKEMLREARENQMSRKEVLAFEEKQKRGRRGRKRRDPFPPLSELLKNPSVIISRGKHGRPIVTIDVDYGEKHNCLPEVKISDTQNTFFPPEGEDCILDYLFA